MAQKSEKTEGQVGSNPTDSSEARMLRAAEGFEAASSEAAGFLSSMRAKVEKSRLFERLSAYMNLVLNLRWNKHRNRYEVDERNPGILGEVRQDVKFLVDAEKRRADQPTPSTPNTNNNTGDSLATSKKEAPTMGLKIDFNQFTLADDKKTVSVPLDSIENLKGEDRKAALKALGVTEASKVNLKDLKAGAVIELDDRLIKVMKRGEKFWLTVSLAVGAGVALGALGTLGVQWMLGGEGTVTGGAAADGGSLHAVG